jgi:hypothetical protein
MASWTRCAEIRHGMLWLGPLSPYFVALYADFNQFQQRCLSLHFLPPPGPCRRHH